MKRKFAAWIALALIAGTVSIALAVDSPIHQQNVNSSNHEAKPEVPNAGTADERIADYTMWLMRFTGALAIIGAVQIIFLFLADRTARTTAEAARKSAEVAFLTTRPYLLVDRIRLSRRDKGGPIEPNAWFASVKWKNTGRTVALIEKMELKITPLNELPPIPDYSNPTMTNTVVALQPDGIFDTQQFGPTPGTEIEYVLYGRIIYKDLAGNIYKTGFAQSVSPHMPVCNGIKNQAYTYSE